MRITVKELTQAVDGKILYGSEDAYFDNITTASDRIKGNDLFIPIVGERTDGHLYIGSAFENGASVSLTQNPGIPEDHGKSSGKALVSVENTVDALQKFAAYYREKYLSIPFVGVTGSVGKTTTREMISAALRSRKRVCSTRGNANSQVGVPITVFETDADAEIAVTELGISRFGEMPKIARVTKAEFAVITNIGISHLAQFKTQENILREKLQILTGSDEDAVLLLNGDDPLLGKLTEDGIHALGTAVNRKISVIRYGLSDVCSVRAENIVKENGIPSFDYVSPLSGKIVRVKLSVPGDHMIMNALAALYVSEHYGADASEAAEALNAFTGFEGRGNQIRRDGYLIINDSYNASPASMQSGLRVLEEMKAEGRKIAVLADMKELGEDEEKYHRELGEFIRDNTHGLDILYTYGQLAALTGDEAAASGHIHVKSFDDFDLMKKELYNILKPGDILFLKGSWSMGLGRLI